MQFSSKSGRIFFSKNSTFAGSLGVDGGAAYAADIEHNPDETTAAVNHRRTQVRRYCRIADCSLFEIV